MPEAAERRILDVFEQEASWGALFRKTSCGVAYAHGEADYNGHYGIRELCDICPPEQIAKCEAAWVQPDLKAVTREARELGATGEVEVIPVPDSLQPFIGGLPVHNASGGLPYPGLLRKSWDRAVKRIGLPEYNPHDLRHKWATVTLTSGVSIHEVSRRLGHRSIKVTVDKYGHLTQDGRERCRQVVEAAMAPHMLTTGRTTSEPGADSVSAGRASTGSRHRPYRF
ncbi:tyrosine-type recombinase/integrase [Streptomyces sp. JV185]|uniref:tyrosine-type recombinase/integrase n=1 Tax=Streptomyces sp. JV185 TaxID=858638 RepID=UPI002E76487A|nr:tyrosine-type recombinase/integrase [Streptomyces sp. JV185]MEE1770351.1 tyrosine-type recombinase/integrase [Streptomyces sp. JV185]